MVLRRTSTQEGPLLGPGYAPVITEQFIVLARPHGLTVVSHTTGAVLYATTTTLDCRCMCAAANHESDAVWIGHANGTIGSYVVTATALELQRTVRIAKAQCSVEELLVMGASEEHVYAVVWEPKKVKDEEDANDASNKGHYSLRHYALSTTVNDTEKGDDWSAVFVQLDHFSCSRAPHRPYLLAGSEHGVAWSRPNGKMTFLRLYNHDNGMLNLGSRSRRGQTITALACQVTDVAVGYDDGVIQRYQDVWSLPFHDPRGGQAPDHKALSTRIVRRLHWHAHAVACIAMDGAGRLHSGGEEAVWITWDSTGSDKPMHKLPRICVGCLDHLVLLHNDSVMLVYCRTENSMRAYELHNKQILWKHRGYCSPASSSQLEKATSTATIPITVDPVKQTIVFMSTPAKLCSFSPDQRRVVNEWMVCPYNHVSRTDAEEIPRPTMTAVAHHDKSWLTSHVSPTEAGPPVCTLQFWNEEDKSRKHVVVAAMTHPHGKLDPIQRLALHNRLAVTMGEGDFRLWHCLEDKGWECFTKVTIPSGYSNLEKGADPVFSSDGSVLALSFGRFVTLWNTDPSAVTFLSSIPVEKTVRQISFCSSRRLVDMLLVAMDDCVSLRTIVGVEWWRHEAPKIEYALFAPDHEAVCVAKRSDGTSSIVLLDARTGVEVEQLTDGLDGGVASIAVMEDEMAEVDVWAGDTAPTGAEKFATMQVFAATADGVLVQFHHVDEGDEKSSLRHPKNTGSSTSMIISDAPRLPTQERQTKKRRIMTVQELGDVVSTNKPLLQEDEDIPLLRGAFVTAFVGRNILRRKLQ